MYIHTHTVDVRFGLFVGHSDFRSRLDSIPKIKAESPAHIKMVSALKKVYLWQTKVSPDAIERLKSNRPELEVISGIVLPNQN